MRSCLQTLQTATCCSWTPFWPLATLLSGPSRSAMHAPPYLLARKSLCAVPAFNYRTGRVSAAGSFLRQNLILAALQGCALKSVS